MQLAALRIHYSHVTYHLHTHSIELALKAYLRAHHVTVKELKDKYRHGLTGTLKRCVELSLKVRKPKRTTQVIEWLDDLSRVQTFRYFEGQFSRLPALHEVTQANLRILNAIRPLCMKALR